MYQDVRIPRRPTLPSGWRVVRLEDTVEVNRDQWDPEEGSGILYLDLTAVIAPGRLAAPKELAARDAPSRARRRVAAGDILVSTVRPYLRGFAKVTQAPNNLIASTGFAVLTPRDEVDGSLIYHHVMAPSFALYLEANMTGQAYPAVRPSDVATYPILLPPLAEQRAIAAVLDSIDGAIERTDDVIAATERLRDALLHELLTRGVPGWHSAWKDVPGLGTVPASWEVVRLGDVAECLQASVDKKSHRGAAGSGKGATIPMFVQLVRISSGIELTWETTARPNARSFSLKKGRWVFTWICNAGFEDCPYLTRCTCVGHVGTLRAPTLGKS